MHSTIKIQQKVNCNADSGSRKGMSDRQAPI